MKKVIISIPLIAFFLFLTGCNKKSPSAEIKKLQMPEAGFSMKIPVTWKMQNSTTCYKGNYIGIVFQESLKGKSFDDFVMEASTEFGEKVISQKEYSINGHRAKQVETYYKPTDVKVLITYIDMGNKVLWVSFSVNEKDYDKNKGEILSAFKTITIK